MVDLHVHSTASDGTLNPRELVEAASAIGLSAIAICDHDSVEGIDEGLAAGKLLGVEVVPAIEISTIASGWDTHLLGYFIDHKAPTLLGILGRLRESRKARAEKIVNELNRLGVNLALEDVQAEADGGAVGRAHIARALVGTGAVSGLQEAFSKYLAKGRPGYILKDVLEPFEAIELIHSLGGLVSLAHPGVTKSSAYLDILITHGLDAIEAYHTEHSPGQRAFYAKLARQKGLLVTGGSDCHGSKSAYGMTIGSVPVSDRVLDDLKAMAIARRRARG
ncbi:MAG: PHP domain-containing protein [Chloroflexi bacterium]|nr:PHP domain-containing protein [Chloroflexota bacterium]